jgi:thiol-disulfide isomerase/thioredoxin
MSYKIIYIGASWCKTCKEIKPATESLATQFSIPLTILDYDADLDESEQAAIKKVPTIRITSTIGMQEGQGEQTKETKETKEVAEWNVNQVASLREWLISNIHVSSTDDF